MIVIILYDMPMTTSIGWPGFMIHHSKEMFKNILASSHTNTHHDSHDVTTFEVDGMLLKMWCFVQFGTTIII